MAQDVAIYRSHGVDLLPLAVPHQARTDARVIKMWLHRKAAATVASYQPDIPRFLAFVGSRSVP